MNPTAPVSAPISKPQALRLVSRAWDSIAPALDNLKMTRMGSTYLAENVAEEKDHRGFRDGPYGLTVSQSAKLFAVRQLAEYLTGAKPPKLRDFLSHRRSCYTAAALVANYRREIRAAFKSAKVDPRAVLPLDYAELVKTD